MADVYRILRHAIRNRLCVRLTYADRRRVACPHVLGTRAGEARVLVYQFAGESRRGLTVDGDWRCLKVAGIRDISLAPGAWHSRPHEIPQHCVDTVDVAVDG